MPFRIIEGEDVADWVRRIAREQIDGAIEEICHPSLPHPERIHRVRKRCKKVRGLLRLVRPVLGETFALENASFRDTAQLLSPLRDTQSVIDAYNAVMRQFDGEVERRTFAPVRRRITAGGRTDGKRDLDLAQRLDEVRSQLEAARERLAAWPLETANADAWRAGFERTYRQARRAMASAYHESTTECFHEWRKTVKHHWYHLRILQPIWKEALIARAREADELGEMLGLHHDLAVLRARITTDSGAPDGRPVEALVALIGRHQALLEARARPIGRRMFAEKPARIGSRYTDYWEAWRGEHAGLEARRRTDEVPE